MTQFKHSPACFFLWSVNIDVNYLQLITITRTIRVPNNCKLKRSLVYRGSENLLWTTQPWKMPSRRRDLPSSGFHLAQTLPLSTPCCLIYFWWLLYHYKDYYLPCYWGRNWRSEKLSNLAQGWEWKRLYIFSVRPYCHLNQGTELLQAGSLGDSSHPSGQYFCASSPRDLLHSK